MHHIRDLLAQLLHRRKEPIALASGGLSTHRNSPPPHPVLTVYLNQVGRGQVEPMRYQAESGAQSQHQVPTVAAEGQALRGTIQLQEPGGVWRARVQPCATK